MQGASWGSRMQLLAIFVLCHVVPVGLALWGAFRKSPRVHVPAILVLMSDLIGYSMAGAIGLENFPGHVTWFISGPLFAPFEFVAAIVEAPLWVIPLLALGAGIGVFVWRRLWRKAAWRVWTFAAVLAGLMGTWLAAEIAVEVAMRVQVAKIQNVCRFERLPTPQMFGAGLSERQSGAPSHGRVSNGEMLYHWSFRAGDWIPGQSCVGNTSYACSCPRRQ